MWGPPGYRLPRVPTDAGRKVDPAHKCGVGGIEKATVPLLPPGVGPGAFGSELGFEARAPERLLRMRAEGVGGRTTKVLYFPECAEI